MEVAKFVEEIMISPEGIDVITQENGAKGIEKLNINPQEQEKENIFSNFGIEYVAPYPYDINIMRALAVDGTNGDQLRTYMETCRRDWGTKGKVKVPEDIPYIEYNLRELKSCTTMEMFNKILMYKQAKNTKETFRAAKGRVRLDINPIDRAYFEIKVLLNNRENNVVLALNSGNEGRKFRDELKTNVSVGNIKKEKIEETYKKVKTTQEEEQGYEHEHGHEHGHRWTF